MTISEEIELVQSPRDAEVSRNSRGNGVDFDPREWIIQKAINRVKRRNLNWIVGFFGLPGTGKSSSSFDFAEAISERMGLPFGVENIHFAVRDLMHHVNSRPPRGTIVNLDDAETDANSQKWWTEAAFNLSLFGATGRYRGLICEVSAPWSDMLTGQFRSLFHIYFEMQRIDYDRKLVITKPQVPYRDAKSHTIRGKYPRAIIPGYGQCRVKQIAFRLPRHATGPFDTWTEYEEKKDAYMTPLYADMEHGRMGKRLKVSKTERAALKYLIEKMGWSQTQAAKELGYTQPRISQMLSEG